MEGGSRPRELLDNSMSRKTGSVTKWLNHRGIGFITPDGETSVVGQDILVHYSNIKQENADGGFKSLKEGSLVEFDTADDPKNPGTKLIAVNVTGIGGVDCEKREKGRRLRQNHANTAGEGGDAQLYVGNLSSDTTWRDLKDLFQQCGNVERADVMKTGFGLVRFSNSEEAKKAMERFNGFELKGQKLEVRLDNKKAPAE